LFSHFQNSKRWYKNRELKKASDCVVLFGYRKSKEI